MSTAQLNRTAAQINADLALARSAIQSAEKQSSATDRTAGRVATVDHLPALITQAQLGPEMLANPSFNTDLSGWTGDGWDWASGGIAQHTTGQTAALSQSIDVTNGTTYQIEITIQGRTAGSVSVALGSVALVDTGAVTALTANALYQRTVVASGTGSQAFTITPSSDFNGAVSLVSCDALVSNATAASLLDSGGAVAAEVRGSLNLGNSFFGRDAGRSNTTGGFNSFFGVSAGLSNTTGAHNSFFGLGAGLSNTTGTHNSFFGRDAGRLNTTGVFNSFFGRDAGYSNTMGGSNSFLGVGAGRSNTTGANNSFFGRDAGRFQADGTSPLTTASSCVIIGDNARGFSDADTNSVVIGRAAIGRGANTTTLGTSATTNTAVFGDYESLSVSGGVILRSPNGTRYKLTVANGGTLNIVAA